MSQNNNKEMNTRRKIGKDSITETLEENANLLLDQNLIYDLLNHGERGHQRGPKAAENEVAEYLEEPPNEVNVTSLNTMIPNKESRCSKVGGAVEQEKSPNDGMTNFSPFCQVLILELNTERQKSKEMETDLNIAKSSVAEARRELEIMRLRDEQKSKQIEDSNRNIKSITLKCKNSYNVLNKDLEISQKQNKELYMKNSFLENEKKDLKAALENLQEKDQGWKDVQRDAASTNERYGDAINENKKVVDECRGLTGKLKMYEADCANKLEEIKNQEYTIHALQTSLKETSASNSCLEVEVQQLKERHSIVIQKALRAEEQMTQSVTENAQLHTDKKELQNEKSSLRKELHQFYKGKLHTALTQATADMQTRISYLEAELKENTSAETNKMTEMRKFHEEKLKSIVDQYASRVGTLAKKVDSLQVENGELRQQREAIVRALSSKGSSEVSAHFQEAVKDISKTSHIDLQYFKEKSNSPNFEEYRIPISDPGPSYNAPHSGRSQSKEPFRRSNLEGIKVPPLITSTSLSSICPTSGDEPNPLKAMPGQWKSRRKPVRAGTPGRNPRIYTALEIVDSIDTGVSSSNKEFSLRSRNNPRARALPDVELGISLLEREISMLSAADSSMDSVRENHQRYNFNR